MSWVLRIVRVWFRGEFWKAAAFALWGLPLLVAYFAVALVYLVARGLALVGFTAPLRWPWTRLLAFVGRVEERRVAWAGGVARVAPADPGARRVAGYLLAATPLAAVEGWSIGWLLWGLAAVVLALVFWASLLLPVAVAHGRDWPLRTVPEAVGASVAGLVTVCAAPWLTIGLVRAHRLLARRLLGPSRGDQLEQRVEALTESRARGMDAAALERRRIERDLHDGAQQRLVALALALGRARAKLEGDPAAAGELVAEAHEEAKRALEEVRDLARGIHPAVLTDLGLDAAISALAGRCPVPVEIDVSFRVRLPDAVESTAYFFVAEALTNVARHSRASSASVRATLEAGRLAVQVTDDGAGGATCTGGGGLAGLADRLAAFDGRLVLQSPPGGPTVVTMEIPCE